MIEKIVGDCFLLVPQGNSCNSFLLRGEKKIVLIDSGLQTEAKQLRFNLMETGLKPKDVSLILHTHLHADHCSADFLFENAKVRMHKLDAALTAKEDPIATAARAFGINYFPKISNQNQNKRIFKLRAYFFSRRFDTIFLASIHNQSGNNRMAGYYIYYEWYWLL